MFSQSDRLSVSSVPRSAAFPQLITKTANEAQVEGLTGEGHRPIYMQISTFYMDGRKKQSCFISFVFIVTSHQIAAPLGQIQAGGASGSGITFITLAGEALSSVCPSFVQRLSLICPTFVQRLSLVCPTFGCLFVKKEFY